LTAERRPPHHYHVLHLLLLLLPSLLPFLKVLPTPMPMQMLMLMLMQMHCRSPEQSVPRLAPQAAQQPPAGTEPPACCGSCPAAAGPAGQPAAEDAAKRAIKLVFMTSASSKCRCRMEFLPILSLARPLIVLRGKAHEINLSSMALELQ
jgi:hypothetical protein